MHSSLFKFTIERPDVNVPQPRDSVILVANPQESLLVNLSRFRYILSPWSEAPYISRPMYLKIKWDVHLHNDFGEDDSFFLPFNIRYLDIQGDVDEVMLHIKSFPAIGSAFDLLEALKLVDEGGNTPVVAPILLPAPNLHMLYLSIQASTILLSHSWQKLPWAQLTHVCIEKEMGLRAWHQMIRQCPRLEKCFVDFEACEESDDHQFDTGEVDSLGPVVLNNLKELDMGFSSNLFGPIFRGLFTPVLESLEMENHPANELDDLGFEMTPCSVAFLHQVASRLTCLSLIHMHGIDANGVLEILQLTKRLRILQANIEGDYDVLLEALIIRSDVDVGGMSVLVPKLCACDIFINKDGRRQGAPCPTLTASSYSQAVLSRWRRWHTSKAPSGDAIERARADHGFRWSLTVDLDHTKVLSEIQSAVKRAQEQGLQLHLESESSGYFWTYDSAGGFDWEEWTQGLNFSSTG